MDQFIEFVKNHWQLWLAFVGIIGLIIFEEIKKNLKGTSALSPQKVVQIINNEEAIIIDLQEPEAFAKGHIVGSINIPYAKFDGDVIPEKIQHHGNDNFVILVDINETKATSLACKLRKAGFIKTYALAGGLTNWKNASLPLVKS